VRKAVLLADDTERLLRVTPHLVSLHAGYTRSNPLAAQADDRSLESSDAGTEIPALRPGRRRD
jgi:hypothetical protein